MRQRRYRPRTLPYTKQTYNCTFSVDLMIAAENAALANKVSKADYIRAAVSDFLAKPSHPAFEEMDVDVDVVGIAKAMAEDLSSIENGYAEGVRAAATMVAKNSRLRVPMATGGTMGEDIANRILKDLLD